MADFAKYLNLKFAEDKNELFYISDESGKRNLRKLIIDAGESSQITCEEQNIKDYWLENKEIILAVDYNGNERNQFYKLKDKTLVPFIINPDYFHHYGVYDEHERKYFFTRNHHTSEEFELCSYDGEEDIKILKHFESPVYIEKQLEDRTLLMTVDVDNIDKELFIYNIHDGNIFEIPLEKSRFKSLTLKNDGKNAYCISDWEGEYLNIYEVDLHDWSYCRLTTFEWDIEHFKVSDDGKSSLMSINEKGISNLYHFDLENYQEEKVNFRNDGVIHSMEWPDCKELYILFSSVDVPHCTYQLDLKRGERKIILPNNGKAEDVRWQMLSYKSFDGMKVPYFLYESETEHRSAVIHVHGGPESQARPEFNELHYRLCKAGLAVAVPNIRGSLGYGRLYLQADDREKRLDAMKDVVALRKHLIDKQNVNEGKISIMGRSYGGFMTLLLISHHPELWKKAVDIVGISDLTTFLKATPAWRRNLRSAEYGFLGRHDTMFNEISPLGRAGFIKAPLMIFHSHHDARVPYSESVQIAERMKNNGQEVVFTAYENEGHAFMRKESLDDMNGKIVKFLLDER